jgi:hypothetical protein
MLVLARMLTAADSARDSAEDRPRDDEAMDLPGAFENVDDLHVPVPLL